MYKNLGIDVLGVTSRQNEMIELAVTHGFESIEVDMEDMIGRCEAQSKEFACQYIHSAKIRVGSWRLPINLAASDSEFANSLDRLGIIVELAGMIEADRCYVRVPPASDQTPYHEQFETFRQRVVTVAEKLAPRGIQIALALNAAPTLREDRTYPFIHKVEDFLALVRTIGQKNVGIVLDTWNWTVGGGGMDQIRELNADQIIEVRLADIPEDAERESIAPIQRTLPGISSNSIAADVLRFLHQAEYDGPVGVAAQLVQFPRMTREAVVVKISEALDRLLIDTGIREPKPTYLGFAAAEQDELEVEEVADEEVEMLAADTDE